MPHALCENMEEEQNNGLAWGWRDFGAAVAMVVLGTALLLIGGRSLADMFGLATEAGFASPIIYIVGLGSSLLMLLGVYLFAVRRAGWAALGLVPAPAGALIATPFLVLLGLVGVLIVNLAITLIQGSPLENPQVEAISGGQPLQGATLFWLLLLVAGLVPIAEELLFRGMLYPLLRVRFGPVAAVLLNAAIFAAVHIFPTVIPALFIVGLLIAFLREWSGSVVPCILYHMIQNSIGILSINAALGAA